MSRIQATRGRLPPADVPIRIVGQQEAAADLLEHVKEEDGEGRPPAPAPVPPP